MCFPLKSTKAPINQTSASKCTTCSTLEEHQPNSHPKLTKHNVVLLSTIRDCKNRADSRDRERERERDREREERRAEERREREREREERERERERERREERERERETEEREREERKKGEQLRRCKHRKTVRSTKKVVKATGPATLPAPINSCCNGIRDNLRVEKESALELLCEAGHHWEQAGCE